MRKKTVIVLMILTAMLSLATGAFAAGNLTEIKAYLNGNVQFRLDGKAWKPVDETGHEMLPITYNGRTYLPLRVIADAFNIPITWENDTQTIGLNDTVNTDFYSKDVKAELNSEAYYDIVDKSQLVFGGKQYNGAYAIVAQNFGGWAGAAYNVQLDFGKKYNTLHLVLYGDSAMKIRVLNGNKQQLTGEISLSEEQVTELDVDLQGSRYAYVYAYDAENQAGKPLLYVLKDSYVTTKSLPPSTPSGGLQPPTSTEPVIH